MTTYHPQVARIAAQPSPSPELAEALGFYRSCAANLERAAQHVIHLAALYPSRDSSSEERRR